MTDGEIGLWTRDLCFVAGLFERGRSRKGGAQVSAATTFSNRGGSRRFAENLNERERKDLHAHTHPSHEMWCGLTQKPGPRGFRSAAVPNLKHTTPPKC